MSAHVASLGMYDHPGQHDANNRLWHAMADALHVRGVSGVPAQLDRDRPVQTIWRDSAMLFGQACGYPLVTDAALALRVVAIPVYDVPGCHSGEHLSYIVTRRDGTAFTLADYRGRRAAINDRGSNTGLNLFRAMIAKLADRGSFFSEVIETGSHRGSIAAILDGGADIAAIDAVTYAAIDRFEPEATRSLRILDRTAASPAPPFVTAGATTDETLAALRLAVTDVIANPDPDLAVARGALFLTGVVPGGKERFTPLRTVEAEAVVAGYPNLR